MYNLHALLPEDAVKVEVLHIQSPSYLTGAVVPYSGATGAVSAVGYIDLVTISPGASLCHFRTFEVHSSRAQVALYESCKRASLHKSGQHLDRQTEVSGHAGHVGLCTCSLKMEYITALDRLSALGSDSESHTCGDEKGILAALLK